MQLYTVLYEWGTRGKSTVQPVGFGQSSCRAGAGSASNGREDGMTNTLLTSQRRGHHTDRNSKPDSLPTSQITIARFPTYVHQMLPQTWLTGATADSDLSSPRQSFIDAPVLAQYASLWTTYVASVRKFNRLSSYHNRHWVGAQRMILKDAKAQKEFQQNGGGARRESSYHEPRATLTVAEVRLNPL